MRRLIARFFLVWACCLPAIGAQAQETNAGSIETFDVLFARGKEQCRALWADHAFDALRKKIPLTEDKPTFAQLTNREKLTAKDRPMADQAVKTVEKCREGYGPAYSKLAQPIQSAIHGVERKQDALIAELYVGRECRPAHRCNCPDVRRSGRSLRQCRCSKA